MGDVSDFQRGQIVGARMAGATVTEIAQLLGIPRGTVFKVMTVYEKEGKTSSARHKSGCSSSLFERDRRKLNRIARNDHKTTASEKTTRIVRRELHKCRFYGRAAIKKTFAYTD